ncbi:MAG: sigma-70 family RNA polymerase sigma factor [Rhodobacterales bacterium]|nr:sigma-70 family RNA polymerase sigma factor [Rhodobacterales bacterium]
MAGTLVMNPMPTDLQRAVRGDRDALKRVLDVHWPQMRRWALLRCGDRASAEDASQESVVRLLKFIRRYDPARPFGPWLKTLVHNACHDELAKRGRVAGVMREVSVPARHGRTLDFERMAKRVIEAFEDLTPRQREIVTLVDLQHRSPTEVAEALGLSPGAVRAQLFVARRRVRIELPLAEILPLLREA